MLSTSFSYVYSSSIESNCRRGVAERNPRRQKYNPLLLSFQPHSMQNDWLRLFRRTLRSIPRTLKQQRAIATSNRNNPSISAHIGSAPQYTRHLVLHTPVTSDRWPTRIETVSPLLRQLGLEKDHFKGLGYSFAEATSTAGGMDDRIRSWENVEEQEE